MAANMPTMHNALMRPAEGPSRFTGSPGGDVIPPGTPRMSANALMIPRAPVAPPAAPMAPPLPAAPVSAEPQPGIDDPISPRVPVPKGDFPEAEHKDLHETTMGPAFDRPEAADWAGHMYGLIRRDYPHIHPRHALEAARDAYYAVKHGFADHYAAGYMANRAARARHAADEARQQQPNPVI